MKFIKPKDLPAFFKESYEQFTNSESGVDSFETRAQPEGNRNSGVLDDAKPNTAWTGPVKRANPTMCASLVRVAPDLSEP